MGGRGEDLRQEGHKESEIEQAWGEGNVTLPTYTHRKIYWTYRWFEKEAMFHTK